MREVTITLTESELAVLMGAIDLGVKGGGARMVRPLAPVLEKLEQAASAAQEQAAKPAPDQDKETRDNG